MQNELDGQQLQLTDGVVALSRRQGVAVKGQRLAVLVDGSTNTTGAGIGVDVEDRPGAEVGL